jgi:WD40 repeat protein
MQRSLLFLFGFIFVGFIASQGSTQPTRTFEIIGQIGQLRPQGVEYNRVFDQYVMIDSVGNLILMDATTYTVQHTLYPVGTNINSYEFSHNGELLAVAIDTRIDIWDTRTGQIVADFAPDGALSAQRPLYFSEDDAFLAFETVIRAPQAIRRSENDTSILPWLWDLAAGRRIRGSELPGRVQALPFFESRGGVVLGPNNTLIAAFVERLWIQQWDQQALTTATELYTGRAETDPLQIWQSLGGDSLYINDDRRNRLYQVDTVDKTLIELPLNSRLSPNDYAELSGEIVFSPLSRVIGERLTRENNSLLDFLLGVNYRSTFDYHPLTVTVIDILDPMTLRPDEWQILIHVFNEQTAEGQILALRPDAIDLVLHPDGDRIAVRRTSGIIEVYRLSTGALERTFTPLVTDLGLAHELDFDATGEILISDFARYDLQTGALISDLPEYVTQFDAYYFSLDSQFLFTHRGDERWTWDLNTNRVIARETINIRGSVISASPDNGRYLVNLDDGIGIEIYTIGTGDRQTLIFDPIPGRPITDMIPSPDWQHFIVVYGSGNNDGGAIALYHLERGWLWTIEGADLPESNLLNYGWVDLDTIYAITEGEFDFYPDRIYGITYHGSGLPQCLVDRFPDDYGRWLPIWELFQGSLRGDQLHRLAIALCATSLETTEAVDAIFTPTPTQPSFDPTPTRSLIAGVPSCLTDMFASKAIEYAQEWRRLTENLTDPQIDQLAILVCESTVNMHSGTRQIFGDAQPIVMTIDIHTQLRSRGAYIPQITRNPTRPSAFPVIEEFFRVEGRQLNNPVVSPDGQMIAEFGVDGRIQLWRMNTPYSELIANLTATVAAQITAQNLIGVRPTETLPFTPIGTPGPTLTATMSLTPPPRPESTVPRSSTEIAASQLYTVADPPPGWSPIGRMIVGQVQDLNFGRYLPTVTATPTRAARNRPTAIPTLTPLPDLTLEPSPTPVIPTQTPISTPTLTPTFSILNMDEIEPVYYDSLFWLDPRTGQLQIDETIPRCDRWFCSFSFDLRWMIYQDREGTFLMRPDGSDRRVLQDFSLTVPEDDEFSWDHNLLLYESVLINERTQVRSRLDQHFDPNVSLETPIAPRPTLGPINSLFTASEIFQPPITGRYVIAQVRSFDRYTYYTVNIDTGEQRFFARTSSQMETVWHPSGDRVYYRYGGLDWYVFDTETEQHHLFGGNLPEGIWSPDGRYLANWYDDFPSEEAEAREDANLPVPKLQVWDSETGETRLYSVPDTGYRDLGGTLLWSPDSRHLAFQAELESERAFETARPHLLVLELETGYVITLGYDLAMPTVWYAEGGE